jgi:hypothetical protein
VAKCLLNENFKKKNENKEEGTRENVKNEKLNEEKFTNNLLNKKERCSLV